jgi:isoleucyl-tRNA synthetase
MKYQAGKRRKAIEYEKDLVQYWIEHKTFEKSVEQRPKDNRYVFYDGPPFITGIPHHGTLLSSVVKDAVPRYQTMKGKRVERVWGWDCHGLPAEVFTEKKLGIQDKRDIGTKITLEEYITTCRDNMVQTGNLWEDTIARIGRWVDFKGAYKTMDKEYMESVWWAFKQLYDKGKIYEGEKVLLYCVRDATPISKSEVAMDNSYQDVTDPSVYVKFKLTDQDASLLAWTTTPWTLPANTAVAVNPDETYVLVEVGNERLILARALVDKVLTDDKHNVVAYTIKSEFLGKELIGKTYKPLFENRGKNAHKVWAAGYVTLEEGTGIVHLAPAYGEEDYQLAKALDFPLVSNIDDSGFYTEGPWKGQYIWEANKPIAKALYESRVIWKIEYIRHSYPHCHRCGTKLMYRAHPSWFLDIEGQRQRMLEENGDINWFPEHIKHGRFENTVQSAPDWNLSRDRFWATAMPVWRGVDEAGTVHTRIVGSYEELKELSGVELEDYHRPWIDDVTFTIDKVKYKRIDKVLDGWFESGSMPFAQFHYPFENAAKFEADFPGDFIAEYVGQVRAWFYYLHAVNVGLFDKHAFKNVIVTGTVAGNDGRKMSKSFGNYTDPNELMDTYSADSLRFLLLSSPLLNGEDFSLQDKEVADVNRKLAMIWNMYDFFTMYAEVDGWEWSGELTDPSEELTNPLDQWIVSRVHQLVGEVERHMDAYDVPNAVKPILPFIDDASNWYVRRSRRRFWKSGNDTDKQLAYKTLHYVLVRLSMVIAPFTPFLAEELYQKLTGGESVHLLDWLPAGHVNDALLSEMEEVREYVTQTLAIRAQSGIKVRQPLALLSVPHLGKFVDYQSIIKEEVNVKTVELGSQLELDTHITESLRSEGIAREIIRHIQGARKAAGLSVDDHIVLSLETDSKQLQKALSEHQTTIAAEVLATKFREGTELAYSTEITIEGDKLIVGLEREK